MDGQNASWWEDYLKRRYNLEFFFLINVGLMWVFGQLACSSTNPTGPEVNDHVIFQ
jgi:hypothetical protein